MFTFLKKHLLQIARPSERESPPVLQHLVIRKEQTGNVPFARETRLQRRSRKKKRERKMEKGEVKLGETETERDESGEREGGTSHPGGSSYITLIVAIITIL